MFKVTRCFEVRFFPALTFTSGIDAHAPTRACFNADTALDAISKAQGFCEEAGREKDFIPVSVTAVVDEKGIPIVVYVSEDDANDPLKGMQPANAGDLSAGYKDRGVSAVDPKQLEAANRARGIPPAGTMDIEEFGKQTDLLNQDCVTGSVNVPE